ncbi:transketolase family protein [Candidatus Pacearchaeota archaeon]|nr:transketolase family protein [Candidatus Pacearchaeota archaeon]
MADKMKSQKEIYGETLLELGKTNENIFVITSDLGNPTKAKMFGDAFPDRYADLGIAEQNAISVAGGVALGGLRPFYSTFGVFAASNFGQIRQSIVYSKAPVVIVGTHGGLIGKDGASHQALEEISLMSSLPGMNVFQPADLMETKQIIEFLSKNNMIAYVRLSRHPQKDIHTEDYQFEFNKARKILKKDNPRIAILSTGYIAAHALEAGEILNEKGIPTEVVSFSTLSPIDKEAILEYKDVDIIITLEDHNINGGLGSRVCETVSEEGLGITVKRLGMSCFGTSGDPMELYCKFNLDSKSVAMQIEKMLE